MSARNAPRDQKRSVSLSNIAERGRRVSLLQHIADKAPADYQFAAHAAVLHLDDRRPPMQQPFGREASDHSASGASGGLKRQPVKDPRAHHTEPDENQ
jgi:hypothetical protein